MTGPGRGRLRRGHVLPAGGDKRTQFMRANMFEIARGFRATLATSYAAALTRSCGRQCAVRKE